MPPRFRPIHEGTRQAARIRRELGEEIREARLAAGLSQAQLGHAVGSSQQEVSRIERGQAPWLSFHTAACLLAATGHTLSARSFPAGPPVRDAAHLALLERLRATLAPSFAWATEVPIAIGGDRRALDALITGAGVRIGVEAETRIRDVQALQRELEQKRRDARLDRVILLVLASRANHRLLRDGAQALRRALPLHTRGVLAALRRGRDPGSDGIVVL